MNEFQSQPNAQNMQETQENQQKSFVVVVQEEKQAKFFLDNLRGHQGKLSVKKLEILANKFLGFNPYIKVTEEQAEEYRARPKSYELVPIRSDGAIYLEDIIPKQTEQQENQGETQ